MKIGGDSQHYYLVVCSDIDIVPYIVDISIFSMNR